MECNQSADRAVVVTVKDAEEFWYFGSVCFSWRYLNRKAHNKVHAKGKFTNTYLPLAIL